MAILTNSTYKPGLVFRNKHFNTAYRTLFQQLGIVYDRYRLETSDGDFLDLDFSTVNSENIAILIHGLEGSSQSNYIKSLVQSLNNNHIDVVVLNLRGCSGEPNRLFSSYHSGKTDDLNRVVSFLDKSKNYKKMHIVGFSLGGNIALKYLGEKGSELLIKIKSCATISVPCDLKGSSQSIAKRSNMLYMQRFLRSLKQKSYFKLKQFPNSILKEEVIQKAKDFYDFDNLYTAPAHGFKNAFDYWKKCSSKQFIAEIKIPALLITSMDDPFLSKSCIPFDESKKNLLFQLEITKFGGHVGFNSNILNNNLWLENRVIEFISSY